MSALLNSIMIIINLPGNHETQTLLAQEIQSSDASNVLSSVRDTRIWLHSGGWRYLVLLAILAVLLAGSRFKKGKKLANARWAGHTEKSNARKTAIQELKENVHNEVTLYISRGKKIRNKSTRIFDLFSDKHDVKPALYVPSSQRGIVVSGSPGSGKTKSIIDPLIRSSIELGHTLILFDVKGEQMRRHSAYAASLGYELRYFAPGLPYSDCINPLDLLRDSSDSAMARQIATLINRNTKSNHSRRDDYFGPAGDQLLETVLMLAKGSSVPDFLTAWKILSLPKLARRLRAASEAQHLDLWAEVSATGLMSVANAERTVAGIVGNAVTVFSQFVRRDFLPALVGKTTVPLDLTGKQMLVFQLDEQREAVTAPLVAAMLGAIVARNFNNQTRRKNPLVLCLDEFPSLHLPDLESWVNRFREYGLVTILGYQNNAQLRKRYGPDDAESIVGACATKFIFNPNHEPTAESWSKYLGQKELQIDPRSRTRGRNASTSQSEQFHRVPLMESSEINSMSPGECIFLNPTYKRRMRTGTGIADRSAPSHIPRMKISKTDDEIQARSCELWDRKLRDRLIERSQAQAEKSGLQLEDDSLRIALAHRGVIADWLLPSPEERAIAQKQETEKEAKVEQSVK